MLPPDRLAEFKSLRKADVSEFTSELDCIDARRLGPIFKLAVEKDGEGFARWLGHRETQLKSPPHRSIEKLRVVRGSDGHHITRELINLH